jgi:hypothetical protein
VPIKKKIAFNELKPFPRRKDISIKQAYFSKMIGDAWRNRQLAKRAFKKQQSVNTFKKFKKKLFKSF